jgi:prepilin-type N-terminal cleavage/methylation domain-containing protein
MSKPPRASRHRAGYTLLEISLVVAIIVLLAGASVPLVTGFTREQRLRDTVRELLVLAKTARTEAMTTGVPSRVIFGKKGFAVFHGADEDPSVVARLPAGTTYLIRPFGTEKRERPDNQAWLFQPSGLSEPLQVRVIEGDAWIEVEFDPLTAGIVGESYFIP